MQPKIYLTEVMKYIPAENRLAKFDGGNVYADSWELAQMLTPNHATVIGALVKEIEWTDCPEIFKKRFMPKRNS